jgi:hypothetical protein
MPALVDPVAKWVATLRATDTAGSRAVPPELGL